MGKAKKGGSGGGTSAWDRLHDAEEKIRQAVLNGLQKGTPIWKMPWLATSGRQKSLATGKPYRGTNAFSLALAAMVNGYTDNRWATYNKITSSGHKFIKDSRNCGVPVFCFKFYDGKREEEDLKEPDQENETREKKVFLKWDYVFNLSLTDFPPEKLPDCGFTADEIGERMLAISPVPIHYEGGQAFYRPATDDITLPPKAAFYSTSGFYGTAFHEMVHSTMHKKRCDRKMGSYAAEELVAESGSVMLTAALGIELDQKEERNATSYLLNWIREASTKDFSEALKQAEKAALWLHTRYVNEYGETDNLTRVSVLKYGNVGPNTGLALLPVHDLVI